MAVVGFAEAVGVDIELRRLSARAARGICTADELAWAGDCSERATLLFSAKESAYKVLPTSLQGALRWSDIAIAPRGQAAFTAFVGGTVIDGWWRTGPAILSWAMTRAAHRGWVVGLGKSPIVGARAKWQCPRHFRSSHKGLTDGHLRVPEAVDTAHRRDAPSPSNDAHAW